jgi:hypothetical protein
VKVIRNLVFVSLLILGLTHCTTVGQFKPVSTDVCDKIAYYDAYVETAQRAMFVLQFAPGVANYIGAAASALILADGLLDDAKAVCDLAAKGDPAQTKAALDAVFNAIQRFNEAYGQAKLAAKGGN